MILDDDEIEQIRALNEQEDELQGDLQMRRIRDVMSSVPGREFIYELLYSAKIFNTTFNPDFGVMAFNEGRRSVGLQILSQVQAHVPQQYELMMRENHHKGATQ
jgi:hypothetical protein